MELRLKWNFKNVLAWVTNGGGSDMKVLKQFYFNMEPRLK